MKTPQKKSDSADPLGLPDPAQMFESVLGCKWSLHVLGQIRNGVYRPGQIRQSADGLTDKVLNERLNKLLRFGVLERVVYPEAPPRVEYTLSSFGHKFARILDEIDALRGELRQDNEPGVDGGKGEHEGDAS